MSEVVEIDINDGIAVVRLNRPEKHNALDRESFQALADAGDEVTADERVRAVILSGNGDNFCAGIDVSMMPEMSPEFVAEGLKPRPGSPANFFQRAAYVWREVPVPVICAIHGVAFGGGLQIALGADIRYATP